MVSRTVITHPFYFSECTKLSSTPPGSTALAWRPELGVVVYIYNPRNGEDEFKASLDYRICLLPHKESGRVGDTRLQRHMHTVSTNVVQEVRFTQVNQVTKSRGQMALGLEPRVHQAVCSSYLALPRLGSLHEGTVLPCLHSNTSV